MTRTFLRRFAAPLSVCVAAAFFLAACGTGGTSVLVPSASPVPSTFSAPITPTASATPSASSFSPTPSVTPTPTPAAPVDVTEARGEIPDGLVKNGGLYDCDKDSNNTPLTLNVPDDTIVQFNNTEVRVEADDSDNPVYTVSLSPSNQSVMAGIVDGDKPFSIPMNDDESLPDVIRVDPARFNMGENRKIFAIVLCF